MSSHIETWALVKVGTLKVGQPSPDGSWERIDMAPSVIGVFDSQASARDAAERYANEDGSTNPVKWFNFTQGEYVDWIDDTVRLTIAPIGWGEPGWPKEVRLDVV